MAILPEDIPTGKVTGQFYFVNEDTIEDPDLYPQLTVVTGFVRFKASIKVLRMSARKAVVIPLTFDAKFNSEGKLVPADHLEAPEGIYLPATDSTEFDTTGWTWTATFEIKDAVTGHTIQIDPITFQVPVGSELDLSTIVPAPDSPGVITTRGPQGVPGDKGDKGDIGPSPTDPLVAGYLTDPESESRSALSAAIGDTISTYGLYQKPPANLQERIIDAHPTYLLRDFDVPVSKVGTAGTFSYDENIKYGSTRSLKMTTGVGGLADALSTVRIDLGAGNAVNMSDSYLTIMGRVEAAAGQGLDKIQIFFYDEGFTNASEWALIYGGALDKSRDRWELVSITNSTSTVASSARYMDIRISALDPTRPLTVYFNELRRVQNRAKGVITFTFDGGYAGQYGQTFQMMKDAGFLGSMMQNFSGVDDNTFLAPGPGGAISGNAHTSMAELADFHTNGWDMSTHSGVLVTNRNPAYLHRLARSRIGWLQAHGYDPNEGGRFFAALTNQFDPAALKVLREYFWLIRTGSARGQSSYHSAPSLPVVNPSALVDIGPANTLANHLTKMDRTALHKQWSIFTLHEPDHANEPTVSDTQAMITKAKALVDSGKVEVKTLGQVFDEIILPS